MSIIIPANSAAGGGVYEVDNSCRFNSASSDYLTRTPSSTGNRRTATWSAWIKKSSISGEQAFLSFGGSMNVGYTNGDSLRFNDGTGNALYSNNLQRDTSAWYHFVIAIDTTQGTAANRVKMYINGVQVTSFAAAIYPDVNEDLNMNQSSVTNTVGSANTSIYFNGYMAEVCWIDGQQLTPTDFGEFDEDSGIWKPISVSGLTFGTNGFYLDFEDSGALGADVSGESNNFTVNNLTAIDQTTDTPTNNFITLNPLITLTSRTDNQVYSEGNTIVIPNSTDNYGTAFSTIGLKGGKWYWEAQIIWNGTSNNANFPRTIGFMREDYPFDQSTLGQADTSWGVGFADLATDGWVLDYNGSSSAISGATSLANNKMLMFALDLDNGKFYMGYDGSWFTSGDPTSGATGTGAIATLDATDLSFTIIPALTNATNTTYYKMNFGNPAYAISSSNTDGDGFGNFEFEVPNGYFSWCTKNLAEYG